MRIGRIAAMSYTPGRLEYFNFIRGGAGADYHQNPEFYSFANGDLLMHWPAYDFDECSNHMVKLFSISKDRGLTWTDPQVYMADYPGGIPYYILTHRLRGSNAALMVVNKTFHHEIEIDESRRIATAGSNYFKSKTRTYLRRSTDGGRTFDHGQEIPYLMMSGGKSLPEVGYYGSVDHLLQLQPGRVTAALSHREPDRTPVFEYVLLSPLADLLLGRPNAADPANWGDFLSRLGWEAAVRQAAIDQLDLACRLGHDMIYVIPNQSPPGEQPLPCPQFGDDPVENVAARNLRNREIGPVSTLASFVSTKCCVTR